jgi:RNA polymerase primary sigma factor
MIRAELKFKNAGFINALKQSGYKSIAEFSRASGIPYSSLIEYASLRSLINNVNQRQKMIELLNSDEWTLFLQYKELLQKEGVIKSITKDIPVSKLVSLSSKNLLQIESNQDIEYDTNQDSLKTDINQSLSSIKIREKDIVEMFFGMGKYKFEHSLKDIAFKYGLSRERTRQIKEKAVRRLRHESRSKRLRKHLGKEREA